MRTLVSGLAAGLLIAGAAPTYAQPDDALTRGAETFETYSDVVSTRDYVLLVHADMSVPGPM